MDSVSDFRDYLLSRGRSTFSSQEAQDVLGLKRNNFNAAANRLIKKQRLASPCRGFYIILRPEDHLSGAPEPECWIDPVMKYLQLNYRISLLHAAALHGASHQATMVYQVVVPKQLRKIEIGQHRVQFIFQSNNSFSNVNLPEWLAQIKHKSGFATMAGVELTLLDCIRYYRKAAGMNGVAQIVKDIGSKAVPRKLAKAARFYENSTVRRLGYLLDFNGHIRQAKALEPFTRSAKSMKPLNPSLKPLSESLPEQYKKDTRWMLEINDQVEIDY